MNTITMLINADHHQYQPRQTERRPTEKLPFAAVPLIGTRFPAAKANPDTGTASRSIIKQAASFQCLAPGLSVDEECYFLSQERTDAILPLSRETACYSSQLEHKSIDSFDHALDLTGKVKISLGPLSGGYSCVYSDTYPGNDKLFTVAIKFSKSVKETTLLGFRGRARSECRTWAGATPTAGGPASCLASYDSVLEAQCLSHDLSQPLDAPKNYRELSPDSLFPHERARAGSLQNRHYDARSPAFEPPVLHRDDAPTGDPDSPYLNDQVVIPDYQHFKFGRASLVYPGMLHGKAVAVKVLKAQKGASKATNWERGMRGEITSVTCTWAALRHPNVLPFYGHSENFGDFGAFISPWYERGSAQRYLATRNPAPHERVRLTQDVCEGLRYLHQVPIVHGDLKPMNILIDDEGVGRICDFGLSRLIHHQELSGLTRTTVYDGPERYMAPEQFASADNHPLQLTFEGDIYSLGCIILEFIERLCPFQRVSSNRGVIEAILSGLPPALRSESNSGTPAIDDALWNLLEACWGEPFSRPTIATVVERLANFGEAAEGLLE